MKIYTKTGDSGTTSLVYGERISKDNPVVEAYGTCDEANSQIGFAVSVLPKDGFDTLKKYLFQIQTDLFHVGAELSTPTNREVQWKVEKNSVTEIEKMIDQLELELEPLQNFILPGGHPAGAALHVSRTIIRRAERLVVSVQPTNPDVLRYLNRLSDFLFVAARYVNMRMNEQEKILHT